MLPGVVTSGNRGGPLFVRGGEPTQNQVLLDGVVVYQLFHVLGFYSAFPSELLARADLHAGGYGSRYGSALSSVLDVATRSGNKRLLGAAVAVAPFISEALIEGPIVERNASVLASGRASVIEQGAAHLVQQPLPFHFGDVFAKVHGSPTPNFRPVFNHAYRIEATRSDGTTTWVDVTVPPLVEPVPQEPAVSASKVVLSVL